MALIWLTLKSTDTGFLRTMKHNKQLHSLMFSDFCSKVMLAGFGQNVECHKMIPLVVFTLVVNSTFYDFHNCLIHKAKFVYVSVF